MRTTPANDLRVTKTLEAIDTSFRELMLEEGGYDRVTVKALCERARINKKTFYRYYETLDDLLAEVMATYAAAWRKYAGDLSRVYDVAEATRRLFHFGAGQDALYDAITCDPAWERIQREMQDQASGEHAETVPDGFTPALWHLYYAYVSQAGLALYRAWVADGKTVPVEEAAEMAASLVSEGAEGYLAHMSH